MQTNQLPRLSLSHPPSLFLSQHHVSTPSLLRTGKKRKEEISPVYVSLHQQTAAPSALRRHANHISPRELLFAVGGGEGGDFG